LQTIFQAFEQADNSITRKYGGTGLGLAICSRLVSLMGGSIRVESQVGQGSIFSFQACFATASTDEMSSLPSRLPSLTQQVTERLRDLPVLVVDDNATNCRLLHDLLASWAMRARVCASGVEALEVLREAQVRGERFGLVLLDARMPEMDGFAVAEQVRRQAGPGQPGVLMLSSADLSEGAQRCRDLGMTYLTKPITRSDLLHAIVAALGMEKQGPALREEAVSASLPAASGQTTSTLSLRILLVEDHPINRMLALRLLQKEGHAVVTVGNGLEALARVKAEPFDVVLMDVQMPEMDGLETTVAILAYEQESREGKGPTSSSPGSRHIPIIAMTAYAMQGDRDRCLEAGMDDYIAKPIHPRELHQAISRVMANEGKC
jgi:CheY-like chemotaxis protein